MTDKKNQNPTKNANTKHILKSTFKWSFFMIKWAFALIVICGFLAGGMVTGYVGALVKDEPVRSREEIIQEMSQDQLSGFVYFNDDELIGQLRGIDRRLVEFEEIPQHMIDAVLAIEDNDFYEHIGIDFSGLMRAVKQRLLNEPVQTGGSTITQQVARNVFLSLERTTSRKVKEILLSMRMERYLSKKQILLAYLNKVPFGNGSSGYNVYGIKAAAEGIFDVSLDQINIAQAAYLAGLPKNPTDYSCFDGYGNFDEEGFNLAMERQRLVLKRMFELGKISSQEYDEALNFDIKSSIAESKEKGYASYPFLMIEAERRAAEILLLQENPELTEEDLKTDEYADLVNQSIEDLLSKGIKIYTTIDKEMYDAMQEIAQDPDNFVPDMEDRGVEQIGAVMIDNKTGAVLGMIEGRGFEIEQYNHATQMERQPGSTMKPLAAYLPAIESGDIQPASIIDDVPLILEDGSKGYHLPNNWNNTFHGLITAREALNRSYNIPALDIFNNIVGIDKAWEFVRELGITTITEEDAYARTGVIGGLSKGVSVEELTNAYAAIPNKGVFLDAYMIRKIEDYQGNVIYEHQPEPNQVFSEQTAFLMTDMLRTVIEDPRATAADLKRKFDYYGDISIAGKTGSTQYDRDAWFVGYSPDITLGVWAGYDQNYSLTYPSEVYGLPQEAGTFRAKNIWALVMNKAIELKPEWFQNKTFERPDNVVRMTVSDISGLIPSTLVKESGHLVTDWFNKDYIPTKVDEHLVKTRVITYDGVNYTAKPETPSDMTEEKVLIKRDKNIYDLLDRIETILNQMPASSRPTKYGRPMTLSDYYPLDMELTAPEEEDPREDDGKVPNPPTNLSIRFDENVYRFTFSPSSSNDVVGYRVYRSVNGGTPVHLISKNILAGEELSFFDYLSSNRLSYYVTAVDVAGKESSPSQIVTNYDPSEIEEDSNQSPSTSDDVNSEETLNEEEATNDNEISDQDAATNDDEASDQDAATNDDEASDQNANANDDEASDQDANASDDEASDQDANANDDEASDQNANASDDNGDSEEDEATSRNISLGTPSVPSGLTVKGNSEESYVTISWEFNPSEESVETYNIYYSPEKDGNYERIGQSNHSSFEYTSPALEGWYTVTAENKTGESSIASPVQFKIED